MMAASASSDRIRPLRADARRNHRQIVLAARDVFVERGPGASLDEIARRAKVGIGTLYRRFTDRNVLMRAVVLDALERSAESAERANDEAPNAFEALTSYLHANLEDRVAAVIPVLLDQVDMDRGDIAAARDRAASATQRIIDAAHAEGTLREQVTFGDIGTMLVRLSRPLPGDISLELSERLAHRHVDLLVDGLRPRPAGELPIGGPRLSLEDLRRLRDRAADEPDGGSR